MNFKDRTKYFLQGVSYIGKGFYTIGEEFSRMFSLFPDDPPYKPINNLEESIEDGFREYSEALTKEAQQALRKDWETVGRDLNNAFE